MCELLKFLIYIAPQTIAVIIGGLLLNWFWIKRANESALIDYFVKRLDDLNNDSSEYWNIDCSTSAKDCINRSKYLEARIKCSIKSLTSDLEKYSERFDKNNFSTNNEDRYIKLMSEVSEACTNGAFETAKRKPDSARYYMINNAINRVKWKLFFKKV